MEFLNHPLIERVINYANNFEWIQGQTPLSSSLAPTIATVVYISGLLVVPRLMNKRDPLKMKTLVSVHNMILTIWSIFMCGAMVYYAGQWAWSEGVERVICDAGGKMNAGGIHVFWFYIFYLSKYYEFLDTLFQLLRKKQPIFLHTYHHVITLWLVWSTMTSRLAIQWADMSLNAGVHIVMYYYYYLSEQGIHPWWKKYITRIQIIQFVLDIGVHMWWYYYKRNSDCSGPMWAFHFGNFVIASFLILFIKFYVDSYRRGSKAPIKKE